MPVSEMNFPRGFTLGTATAAYQIEGAWRDDGKAPSIWDDFAHRPGAISNGDTGDVACDHYHRYKEDVAIMRNIGLDAYRFSISWPRVLPTGRGPVNEPGLDFYDRLVDELLASGIEPYITLYHWDLPLELERRGGWRSPDIRGLFAEYATIMAERLGDRVKNWITLNEPWMFVFIGHLLGMHAPGYKNPWKAMRVLHNALCSHGMAVQAIKAERPNSSVGITLSLSPVEPATNTDKDREAAHRADLFMNRLLLDPVFGRGYPTEIQRLLHLFFPKVKEADLALIATPIDFLGVNTYTREFIRYDWRIPFLHFWSSIADVPQSDFIRNGVQYTDMGYEVYPPSIYRVLTRIRDEYGNHPVIITENGSSFTDVMQNGAVNDPKRIAYLEGYLGEVLHAAADGCDVRGYFVWSLMDNMEWSFGNAKRHGLVYVDFITGQRTPKASALHYAEIIRNSRSSRKLIT
jgi:beta-glucosidase